MSRIVRYVRMAFEELGVSIDQTNIADRLCFIGCANGVHRRLEAVNRGMGKRIHKYSERVEPFRQNNLFISANGLFPVSLAHHLRQLRNRDGSLAARM